MITGALVAPGDLSIHPEQPLMADSPDGLIGLAEGVLEVKCPAPHTHGAYLVGDKIPSEYLPQVRWHLLVTGRQWCDFVSYCEAFPPHLMTFIKRYEMYASERDELMDKAIDFIGLYQETLKRLNLVF